MSDLKKRIAGLVPGTEQHARNNVAKQVKEARQHRDRFKGNYPDTSAKPLELQPGAIKDGYDKIKDKPKEILAKKNLKESTMGNFQSRLLEEEYGQYAAPAAAAPSLGSRVKDNVKSNWKQYAGGAALGGLGAMLGDHFTDTVGDFNDDMQTAADSGNYINTGLDKMQGGLEAMKIGDGSDSNTSGGAASIPSATGTGGNTMYDLPKTAAGAAGAAAAASEGPNLDALKATALKYGHANDDVSNRFWSPATHQKDWWSGDTDVNADHLTSVSKAGMDLDTADQRATLNTQYKDALTSALKDGDVNPAEEKVLSGFKDRINGLDTDYAERASAELQKSMDFAKHNNMDFLLNGNVEDDLAFFKDIQAKYGQIPEGLQPIYQAVMRKVQG